VTELAIPFVVRGHVFESTAFSHTLSGSSTTFTTPDPLDVLPDLEPASRLAARELHALSFDDILEYLEALAARLDLDTNEHLQAAFAASCLTSNLTESVLESIYRDQVDYFFRPDVIRDAAERRLGIRYLEGWVDEPSADGRNVRVRAFGARTLHVIAGNSPGVAVVTIVRNAITRGDALIKTPSNDPMTAVAIARTMAELDPDHPLTRHVSVMYWRGGDSEFERELMRRVELEKIVVWGGGESVKHYSGYAGPGVEVIGLDPKLSAAIIGAEALGDTERSRDAAARLAHDVGWFNQEGCVSPRVAFVDTTGVVDADKALEDFAGHVFEAIAALPLEYSSPATRLPSRLRDELDAARLIGTPFVVGGGLEGGVVVSPEAEPVDFAAELGARYVNLVPVEGFDDVVERLSAVVQTVGVYPDSLRETLRTDLALTGVQRIVTLGGAVNLWGNQTLPQDGIEVLRRMCRWIVDEVDTEFEPEVEKRTL
jgi:hypothetical protein